MTFLKLGARYINLDQVTDIHVSEQHVTVYFAVASGDRNIRLSFTDGEADDLLAWLDAYGTDPPASSPRQRDG